MKTSQTKQFIQYMLSLLLAGALMYWLFKDHSLDEFLAEVLLVDYGWLIMSFGTILLGYWIRAYRWRLLLQPLGYSGGTLRLFYNVMALYLVNLVLPRAGEIYRCGLLYKTDDVPVSASLGTVVVERVFDLIMLLLITALAFVVEYDKLNAYFIKVLQSGSSSGVQSNTLLIYLLLAAGSALLLGLLLFLLFKRQIKASMVYQKGLEFVKQLIGGLTSIRSLDQPWSFLASTIGLWLIYFVMTYFVLLSIPSTSALAILTVLSVLAMGGLGMAAPVQGGIGTYHALVAGVLVLYGISEQDGEFFAAISHSMQLAATALLGGIGLFLSLATARKRKHAINTDKDRQ